MGRLINIPGQAGGDLPIISMNSTLLQALQVIEDCGSEIALVVEQERLAGVLTDGDIRRSLLGGRDLGTPVDQVMQTRFTAVPPEAGRPEVLDLMRAHHFRQIPILDPEGRLMGLHHLHDLIGATVRPNAAVIFCGGRGTRLLPLTAQYPKPMLPVAGRPILERIILHLVGYGFRRFFLAVHFMGEVIEQHFGDGAKFGCEIQYLREEAPLGTGGALSLLPADVGGGILVMNGDLVTQFDAPALMDCHSADGNRVTISAKSYAHEIPYGVMTTRGTEVVDLQEKPVIRKLVNAGIYVLDSDLRHRVPQGENYTIPRLIMDCLNRRERVGHFLMEEDWIDIGQPHELKKAMGML